ncbi:MAG TPA: hypothetical protein VG847_09605 [Chitinophagaceae bacterium]|nr:hypothetical protein [Chitinophagaceae bacterium]
MKTITISLATVLFALPAFSQTKIDVQNASSHIGEQVTICSKVFGTKYLDRSGVTFLNLGAAYPVSPLTVVIFKKDRAHFPTPPEQLYADKKICVTGKITVYNGKDEIIVSKPDAIAIE